MRLLLSLLSTLVFFVGIGCSQSRPNCPDPVAASDAPMTEQEKKLARLKTEFDPSCKSH
jgi:hypothetical protein